MKILCVSDQIDPLVYNENAKVFFSDIDLILCAGDLPMDYVDFIVSTFNKPTFFVFGNHNLKEYKYYHKDESSVVFDTSFQNSVSRPHSHGAQYLGFKTQVCHNILCQNSNERVDVTITNGAGISAKIPLMTRKSDTPLIIAGISGSKRYNNGLCQYTNTQMFFRLLLLVPKLLYNRLRYGKYLDIFLTHASPKGIHDKNDPCHEGFDCFNWFLRTFRPRVMVHGHIHLYDLREERSGKYYETMIVNAYAHCVISM